MADAYTLHCSGCFCVLGISPKNLADEETYCLRCAKHINFKKSKTSNNTPQDCSGQANVASKEDNGKDTHPADIIMTGCPDEMEDILYEQLVEEEYQFGH